MKSIRQYHFHKNKYGEELLIDIVRLKDIKKYLKSHPIHTLTYFDITFIEEGNGFFKVNNNEYKVIAGDVIFSMPGEVREWDSEYILEGYALIFEEEFLLSFFNDPLFLQNLSFFHLHRNSSRVHLLNIKSRITFLIENIQSEIVNYRSKDKHLLRALLYEILMLLNRAYIQQNPITNEDVPAVNRHVHRFVALVNENFKKDHAIRYYAECLCITPNYLNEVVKKSIGMSAKTYIRNKILSEAKRMLAYTSVTVSDIAEELNFESSSYFIRFFRTQTGCTPLQYRHQTKR